ncbi:MAG: hypothetical protein ABGZ53_19840 [Fuerstiella sp.]
MKKTATTVLLAYLAVSLPVFGAVVNLPVAKNLSSHGVTQAELDGQTVTVFFVRSSAQNVVKIRDGLNQRVEQMFPVPIGR